MNEDARVSSTKLRQVLGQFATGVAIVTFRTAESVRGITVNSFTSVSLEPPLVLVCINKHKSSCELLQKAASFAVNILAQCHRDLSSRFAGNWNPAGGHPFEGIRWSSSRLSGAPIIDGVLGYVDCLLEKALDAGDHTIFLAKVEDLGIGDPTAPPLVFHRGNYTEFAPFTRG